MSDSASGDRFSIDVWEDGGRLAIGRGPWTLLGYRYGTGDWRPHIYPLTAPNAQIPGLEKSITQTAPADHLHHRSLWWGHGDVDGVDFWLEAPDAGRVVHTSLDAAWAENDRAGFEAGADWRGPGGETLLGDRRRVSVTALAGGSDGEYTVDLDFTIESRTGRDVRLAQAIDSGFPALRLADVIDLMDGGHFLDASGKSDFDTCDSTAGWLCAWGELDPSPAARHATCSVAVIDHPSNPWSSTQGCTWFTRPFGWFTPAGTQQRDRIVPVADGLRFRHRIVVFADAPSAERVASWAAAFAAQ